MTVKFGQLVECNLGSILEKSHTKCGEETNPEPFSKKIKIEHISGPTV